MNVRKDKLVEYAGSLEPVINQISDYALYVLDTETLERATEIVSHDPAARLWAIEVRPIMDESGPEV